MDVEEYRKREDEKRRHAQGTRWLAAEIGAVGLSALIAGFWWWALFGISEKVGTAGMFTCVVVMGIGLVLFLSTDP